MSRWNTPSEAAFRAALLLAVLTAVAFGTSIGLFIKYKVSSKDTKLDTFEGSITDSVGIRWVVAMAITGGSIAVLVVLAIWLKLSRRSYKKQREKDEETLEFDEASACSERDPGWLRKQLPK